MATLLPSIWLGRFDDAMQWEARAAELAAFRSVCDEIDDRMYSSRRPAVINAWCAVCDSVQPMSLSCQFGRIQDGAAYPAWNETAICKSCNLNSRMRALFSFVVHHLRLAPTAKIYLGEQTTRSYGKYKTRFSRLVGSEYLGPDVPPGQERQVQGKTIRHEDLCRLSFADASLDAVVTQGVFEHIADYKKVFAECRRTLIADGGLLIFTVPFDGTPSTQIRATVEPDGTIRHILPPEMHADPLRDGILCFQNFGWDMLDDLRNAGFSEAAGHLYYGPWEGHFGYPRFVFTARTGQPQHERPRAPTWTQRLKRGLAAFRDDSNAR
jgi:SAM-dependent methyltransferase